MAGKIIVHGFNQFVFSPKVTLYINSNPIAVVDKKQTVEIPITKNCVLSGKWGAENIKGIPIKNGTEVEIQIKTIVYKGFTWDILKETVIDPNAPESDHQEEIADKPIYELDGGVGDILLVYEDRVVIKHKGVLNLMAMGIKGDKTLYYSDITAIQYKRPGVLAGHIQFSILGGVEHTGGVFSAGSDENTITINSGTEVLAEKVVNHINQKLKECKAAKNAGTVIQQASAADEIKKYKELLDMGIITQEEFNAKKNQVLGL